MDAVREPSGASGGLRWVGCLVLVAGLHAALVWMVLQRQPRAVERVAEPDAIMVDLAPEPAAVQPEVAPPVPERPVPMPVAPEPAPEPPPPEIQATPPLPAPEAVLPLPPPARPAPPRLPPVRRAPPRPTPAPSPPVPVAPVAAPPVPGPSLSEPRVIAAPPSPPAAPSNATLNWRSDLVGKLARAKRYPEMARSRGEQGTVLATFTMDRGGHVLSASVTRGSGSYQLDEEAVALIKRAEPLPPLPAEMPGATVTLTVPIAFALR